MSSSPVFHVRAGWRVFWAAPRVLVISELLLFGSWVILETSVMLLHRFGPLPNILLHLAFLWVFFGLLAGMHGIAHDLLDGGAPDVRRLASRLDRGLTFLLALCLYLLAVAVGLVLMVAPGIHVAARYALFGHSLAERRTSALGALREAGSVSRGRWRESFALMLLTAGLNLAGAALLGLGILVSFPVTLLANASFYRSLSRSAAPGSR